MVGRLGAAITGDQSRELSDVDTKTMEQLKKQEEMIQQLQEQVNALTDIDFRIDINGRPGDTVAFSY